MGYDLRRALIAVLACFAVALAAMLLPAAGIGSYPALVGDGGSGNGVTDDGPVVADPVVTPDATPTAVDPGETTTGEKQETETETATPTPTTTDDDYAAGNGDGDGDFPGGLVAFVVTLLRVGTLLTFVAAITVVGGLLVGGLRGGPVRLSDRGETPLLEILGVGIPLGGLHTLSQGSLRTVLGLSRSTGAFLSGLGSAASGLVAAAVGGGSMVGGAGSALRSVGAGLARGLETTARAFGSLAVGAGTLTANLSNWRPTFDRGDSPGTDAREASPAPPPHDESETQADPGPRTVEEAWSRFVDLVPIRRPEARTPGEVARTAVRSDLPRGPVRRLTNAFREVRYGGRSPENRTESAVGAYDDLTDESGDGDDGGGEDA